LTVGDKEMSDFDDLVTCYSNQIVFFRHYRKAYAMMVKSVESTRTRQRPNCCVIAGPSGVGKSTLAMLYRDSFPPPTRVVSPEDNITEELPAFYFCLPSAATVKSFLKTLVEALGSDDSRGDTIDLKARAIRAFKERKVKVCFLDELQFLTRPDTQHSRDAVIDCLTHLLNSINIPIIILGTEECIDVVYSREVLARRYPYRVDFGYLKFSTDENSDYMQLLNSLDSKLYEIGHLDPGVHLTDTTVATGLFIASNGSLEYIKKITCEALEISLHRNRKLLFEDFISAGDSIYLSLNLSPGRNPFTLEKTEISSALERYHEFTLPPSRKT
jgi:hypothetical protein